MPGGVSLTSTAPRKSLLAYPGNSPVKIWSDFRIVMQQDVTIVGPTLNPCNVSSSSCG